MIQEQEAIKLQKVFGIMEHLNKLHRQGTTGYYDCGDVGILHIWWGRHGWEWEWIAISKEFSDARQ